MTIFTGKIHYKWPFSIAMLNYQRVNFESPMFSKGTAARLHILLLLKICLLITARTASISLSAGTPESTTRRRVEKLAPSHNVVTATQQLKPGKVPVILPIELLLSMISNRKGVKLPEATSSMLKSQLWIFMDPENLDSSTMICLNPL